MDRDYLESLGLEKEVIEKVMAKHGQSIQAKNTEISTLSTQLADRDADLTALKADKSNDEELQTKLTDLQDKYTKETEELQNKLQETKLESSVELALVNARSKNLKATKALLDYNELKLSENGVSGLEEQLKTLVEENPYLFESKEKPGNFSKPGNFNRETKKQQQQPQQDLNEYRITN